MKAELTNCIDPKMNGTIVELVRPFEPADYSKLVTHHELGRVWWYRGPNGMGWAQLRRLHIQ